LRENRGDGANPLFAVGQAEAAKQEAADFRRGFPDVISTVEDLHPVFGL
jgi:hypothetical protein